MSTISLCAVGDILYDRDDPESIFVNVTSLIRKADIAFGQLELPISLRGEPILTARSPIKARPEVAQALKSAGFDVLAFACNHTMDFGVKAMLDTIKYLKQQGIAIIGVGKDLAEARKPAIIERKGTRVAFLTYNSILPPGYEARPGKPGCAPLKVWTSYQPLEPFQPGTPCRILTFANQEDLSAMLDDIKKVRPLADVVVISMHWGLHHVPGTLAMYQKEVGHAAIDAGADLILGHHPHILKPIEVYKGKVIFHSLANFVAEVPVAIMNKWKENPEMKSSRQAYELEPDPEYPNYPFHRESLKSITAKCIISNKRIERVSFLPVIINKRLEPEVVSPNDENFSGILNYMKNIDKSQGIHTEYSVEGNEIAINTAR